MAYFLLGLGSNIDPEHNLAEAVKRLEALGRICQISPALETSPVGETFHYSFMNQLVIIHSELIPNLLKIRLQQIEISLGREAKNPARKNKDRTIDIDILWQAEDESDCFSANLEDSYNRQVQNAWQNQLKV